MKISSTKRQPNRVLSAIEGSGNVIVDFIFEQGLLFVEIANLGDKPALDVSVKFSPSFKILNGERTISSLQLFKRLRFLAPRRRIRAFIGEVTSFFTRFNGDTVVTVNLSYLSETGGKIRRTIVHDLGIYRDLPYLTTNVLAADASVSA